MSENLLQTESVHREDEYSPEAEFARWQEEAKRLAHIGQEVLEAATHKRGDSGAYPNYFGTGNEHRFRARFYAGNTYQDIISFQLEIGEHGYALHQILRDPDDNNPTSDESRQELVQKFEANAFTEDALRAAIEKRVEEVAASGKN